MPWDGPGATRKPTASRYAIPDSRGTLPVWNGNGYEYPPLPHLAELDADNRRQKTLLFQTLMRSQTIGSLPPLGMR